MQRDARAGILHPWGCSHLPSFWTVEQRIELIVPHSWQHTVFLGFSKGLSFILLLNLAPVPIPVSVFLPPLAVSLMCLLSISLIGPFPICTHASPQSWHWPCRVLSLSSHLVTSEVSIRPQFTCPSASPLTHCLSFTTYWWMSLWLTDK